MQGTGYMYGNVIMKPNIPYTKENFLKTKPLKKSLVSSILLKYAHLSKSKDIFTGRQTGHYTTLRCFPLMESMSLTLWNLLKLNT